MVRQVTLKEAFRILKPGGLLVSFSCFVDEDAVLPENVRQILRTEYPDAFRDYYAETIRAGFRRIESEIVSVKDTDHDESGFALRCRELGVNIRRTGYVRYCRKT